MEVLAPKNRSTTPAETTSYHLGCGFPYDTECDLICETVRSQESRNGAPGNLGSVGKVNLNS